MSRFPEFATTFACTSRAHCATCRDREGARAWRESLARVYTLPPDAPDFACPHGLPWGAQPEQRGAAASVAEQYRAMCDECPHQRELPDGAMECLKAPGRNGRPSPCVWRALERCPQGHWPKSD